MTHLFDPVVVDDETTPAIGSRPRPRPYLPAPAEEVAAIESDLRLVVPPTDEQMWWYLGAPKRWVPFAMTIAFALAAVSLWLFALRGFWLYPFLGVLLVNLVGSVLATVTTGSRSRVTRAGHEQLVDGWQPTAFPSVDVFLPTCGEDCVVLANTYDHVAALEWPGALRILVLDDSDRAEVAELARQYGFDYLVRPNRGEMKKAGNLKHAYERSDGEIVTIFDADFCPRPDYLHHLVPYLDDPQVGIVQSPQFFDTSARMGWLQRTAGATQEYFYRWVQPSRDRLGAPICVGTNALYRRSALDRIGGFALVDHSEDIYTGIALYRQGFGTRYVPVILAKGLCPDELAPFLSQQYRWAQGSITALPKGDGPTQTLTWKQRACFAAGYLYYLTTALNVFAIQLPPLIMAIAYPQDVRAYHYVPFLAGVWVYMVLFPAISRSRWRFEVLRVQIAYSFSHAVAFADRLRGRTAGWVATGRGGGNPLSERIARIGFVWLTAATVLSWFSLVVDVVRFGPVDFWPMAVFLGGYTYLAVPLIRDFGRLLTRRRPARAVDPTVDTAPDSPVLEGELV